MTWTWQFIDWAPTQTMTQVESMQTTFRSPRTTKQTSPKNACVHLGGSGLACGNYKPPITSFRSVTSTPKLLIFLMFLISSHLQADVGVCFHGAAAWKTSNFCWQQPFNSNEDYTAITISKRIGQLFLPQLNVKSPHFPLIKSFLSKEKHRRLKRRSGAESWENLHKILPNP